MDRDSKGRFKKNMVPWNKGKKLPKWYRKKLSIAHMGQKPSPETIEKMKGKTPWNKGKKMPPEFGAKMSKALTGKKQNKKQIQARLESRRKNSKPLEEKFWSYVNIKGSDDCWEWNRGRTGNGYGLFTKPNGQGRVLSHRMAYELSKGKIPKGKLVCHHCDNPPCCNGNHLFLGTKSDNMMDAIKKRIMPLGSQLPQSKLNEKNVKIAREMYKKGHSINELAKKFRVNGRTMRDALERKTWKHVL